MSNKDIVEFQDKSWYRRQAVGRDLKPGDLYACGPLISVARPWRRAVRCVPEGPAAGYWENELLPDARARRLLARLTKPEEDVAIFEPVEEHTHKTPMHAFGRDLRVGDEYAVGLMQTTAYRRATAVSVEYVENELLPGVQAMIKTEPTHVSQHVTIFRRGGAPQPAAIPAPRGRYEGDGRATAPSTMKGAQMGPGYKLLEVGYDDQSGEEFESS